MRIVAIADDLSGAAETAAALLGTSIARPGNTAVVLLDAASLPAPLAGLPPVAVLDLDYRHLDAAAAGARLSAVIARLAPGDAAPSSPLLFVKIDSLWRGGPAVALESLAAASGAPILLAPSLPGAGRVLRDGVLLVDGVPLHDSGAWGVESSAPPKDLTGILGDLPSATITLSEVRGDRADLLRVARGHIEAGAAVIACEAETDEDLDRVAALAPGLPGARVVGSGGIAAALGRARNAHDDGTHDHGTHDGEGAATAGDTNRPAAGAPSPLFVVGTAEPTAALQVRLLTEHGVREISLPAGLLELAADAAPGDDFGAESDAAAPGEPANGPFTRADLLAAVADIRRRLLRQPVALTIPPVVPPRDDGGASRPGASARRPARPLLALGLARIASAAGAGDLVLIGGQTARFTLDALGASALYPRSLIHHGAVAGLAADGRRVVTRPGSFGDADSLLQILQHLLPPAVTKGTTMSNPRIAVTMGDGAGIGPEVIVGALLDERTIGRCRPIVIGDAVRLRQAAEILGADADIQVIPDVDAAVFTPGRINVIDLGLLPADLAWGELSATAGDAAYQYLRVASELAMAGEVEAICTAPLNKEALHAAGHLYPGHTELLAHFTNVPEVSMMLSTPTVKVIHVTTHIGLIDAVAKVDPPLVERTIRRGHAAMVTAGVANPKIGVCGINPHAGEGGLFGYGEEAEKIAPGVQAAAADGIDVYGPLPADTLFFLAARGDYDLVVAMYHDQGHTPVKVLGIEAGVNITIGLPVIRTSVDHGTAFDIAGTGKADAGSMVEALRQAAEMAPTPAG